MASMHEQTLTQFLLDNQALLYRMAFSYLKNQEDALDAVQTTACKVLENQSQLRSADAVRSWVLRILVRTCLDQLKQRKKLVYLPDEELDQGSYEPDLPDDSLAKRVDALPENLQTVIKLRFYGELRLQEISDVTGWNLNTVKSRLYAGLKQLRVSMEGVEE